MSPLRIAVFLFVVIAVAGAIHYYLWARLVRDPQWSILWWRIGTTALVALAVSIPLSMVLSRTLPRAIVSPLAWLAFGWMGCMFLLLVVSSAADLLRLLVWTARRLQSEAPMDTQRRLWVQRVFALCVGATGLGLAAHGFANVRQGARVQRVAVTINKLPRLMHGLRVVQISDVHVGPTVGHDFLAGVVEQCNALDPHVVAITGDLVDGSVDELGPLVRSLAQLRAHYGVFFVTGNHEYYSGVEAWVRHLPTLGIRVLRNERVSIEHQGGWLDIAGVDDWSAHRFGSGHGADLPAALAERDASRPLLLLAHQPRAIVEAAQHGVDLQISGHTHGGQIVPFNFLVGLEQPYVRGLHRHRDSWIYVHSGTGFWGPPMRLGVPAEIACIELHAV